MNTYTSEDQAIIGASSEINIGESRGWTRKIMHAFPAFALRDYKLYFTGQFVSNIGTWLQVVAQGLLVYQLSHSAYWVGLVTAVGQLPVLFFSLFGGVIVDRYDKKKLLYFTQYASMILAFILGYQALTHQATIFWITIWSLLLGVVNALDMPARQSFIVDIVGKKYLASAIALNSGMFNGARVIGPGIAGLLVATIGVGGTFMVNAVSYIASILSMMYMRTAPHVQSDNHQHPLKAIADGIRYSFKQKTIRDLLIFAGAMSIFGWSYSTLLPVIANNNAAQLGYFYAASGLGALLAAIIVSIYARKVSPMKFILSGNIMFVLSLVAFCFTTSFYARVPLLIFTGFGLLLQFSTMTTLIQFIITDELRGRVMSIYTIMFLGLSPFGSYEIGFLAQYIQTSPAILINIASLLGFTVFLYSKRRYINAAYAEHAQIHH